MTQHPRPAYYRTPKNPMQAMGYSLRTRRFRYTEWREPESDRLVARELYDHDRDPGETENVIDRPAGAAVRDRLAEELLILRSPQRDRKAGRGK
jgi:iduronate 2-sulfatase